jgi:hypothetical protein
MTVRDELCAAKSASAHPSFRPKFALIAARTISTLLQPGVRFWHEAAGPRHAWIGPQLNDKRPCRRRAGTAAFDP